MNLQQVVQPRSANGFGRRRVEREIGNRSDNKSQTGKTNSSKLTSSGENTDLNCFMFVSRSSL